MQEFVHAALKIQNLYRDLSGKQLKRRTMMKRCLADATQLNSTCIPPDRWVLLPQKARDAWGSIDANSKAIVLGLSGKNPPSLATVDTLYINRKTVLVGNYTSDPNTLGEHDATPCLTPITTSSSTNRPYAWSIGTDTIPPVMNDDETFISVSTIDSAIDFNDDMTSSDIEFIEEIYDDLSHVSPNDYINEVVTDDEINGGKWYCGNKSQENSILHMHVILVALVETLLLSA